MSSDANEVGDRPLIRAADLPGSDAHEVGAAVRAYLQQTELEKLQQGGVLSPDVRTLPEQYLREVEDPAAVYAGHLVLVAELADRIVGVVVVAGHDGIAEVKRLWAVPEVRGRGVGSALLDAAVQAATTLRAAEVRLSVWDWRDGAMRLYESRGFVRVPSWDPRDRLVCLSRPITGRV